MPKRPLFSSSSFCFGVKCRCLCRVSMGVACSCSLFLFPLLRASFSFSVSSRWGVVKGVRVAGDHPPTHNSLYQDGGCCSFRYFISFSRTGHVHPFLLPFWSGIQLCLTNHLLCPLLLSFDSTNKSLHLFSTHFFL